MSARASLIPSSLTIGANLEFQKIPGLPNIAGNILDIAGLRSRCRMATKVLPTHDTGK
jgi:hypothetical protein